MMKLYSYFRSSASFRVRIALNLKGLPYDYEAVHLARGEHRKASYSAISPDGLVPLLEDGGERLSQSMAIIEYLDETHPQPPLLPADAVGRAQVRAADVLPFIEQARRAGATTLQQLADALAARGVPTPSGRGRRWHPVQVARIVGRHQDVGIADVPLAEAVA